MITKDELKITQKELDATKIERLSNRPNTGASIGGGALSATEMKRRYDAAPELISKKFNALVDALAGVDEEGKLTDKGIASLIMTGLAEKYSLKDLLEGLGNGEALQWIMTGIEDYSVKGYLKFLKKQLDAKFGQEVADGWKKEIDAALDESKQEIQGYCEETDKAIAVLSAAIDFIKDGTTTEEIDSIKELVTYVNEHGATTTAMQNDIKKNSEAIAEHHAIFAGALRGSKMGEGGVLLDDVSTVSGTLECRVFGKNLIPFPYVDKTGKPYASAVQTVGGVTVTFQEDGGIALEGRAESVVDVALFAGELLLPAGWYTISGADKREDITVYVRQLVHGVDTYFVNTYDGRNVKAEEFTVNRIGIYITAGTVVPAGTVIYPMFSMGNEAPSEYQRAGTVTLKACGKNLFDTSADVVKVWAYYGFDIKEKASIFGENLYLSIKLKPGKSIPPKIAFGFPYNYVEKDGRVMNNAILVLNNGSVVDAGLRIPVWYDTIGVGAYCLDTTIMSHAQAFEAVLDAFYVQLEVGTTKTDYVPFSFYEEYTADENGEVNIPSRSPYMFIKDKDGTATLIVNYNRDINIALERIEQAIISMGGNV